MFNQEYDVIVVGGGHDGSEAEWAFAHTRPRRDEEQWEDRHGGSSAGWEGTAIRWRRDEE